jgi:hypothetical protein
MTNLLWDKFYLLKSNKLPASFEKFIANTTQFEYLHRLASEEQLSSLHRVAAAAWPKPQSTGQYRVTGGAPTRKVLLDQERWELSKLPVPGLKEHLSDAIVACSGEDARIV